MTCIGSKPLRPKVLKSNSSVDMCNMSGEDDSTTHGRRRKDKHTKARKGSAKLANEDLSHMEGKKKNKKEEFKKGVHSSARDISSATGQNGPNRNTGAQKMKSHDPSRSHASVPRKRVDPETAKYFAEIANLFESKTIDLEDRSAVCGNALEETRGKELELATDVIISRTLQTLLEGCDVEQLCGFLRSCVKDIPSIAKDKSGSHVTETALKSLALHIQDEESYSMVEDTLNMICQVVVVDSVELMTSLYGSHVLRSLLCLCKGVPLDSSEALHVTKPSAVLTERFNSMPSQTGSNLKDFQHGFEIKFKFLVREMLNYAKEEMKNLRVNKYSSFVLQALLKLSVGDDEGLLHSILAILGCEERGETQEKSIRTLLKEDIMDLFEDTASSHLLEVIIEVAPEALYNEILNQMFKGSLFDVSSHHCGNFTVQALISSARTGGQLDVIWAELGPKLVDLLETGKSGVTASLLAACQRLQIHAKEGCQAVAAAVSSDSESSSCIVPHILFLESYLREKSFWKWPEGEKMHTLGCLMLQTIFRCPNQFIQPYVTSILSMDPDHIFQTAKDVGGSRVFEAFLCSDVSANQKVELIAKLRDHFGELSMHPSSSFTVEKCFAASNLSLKEVIAAELLVVQRELSKIKHGSYLLAKLDITGYTHRPEQWRSRLASKETAYRQFHDIFGSKSKQQKRNVSELQPAEHPHERANKRRGKSDGEMQLGFGESNVASSLGMEFPGLEDSMAKLGFPGHKNSFNKRSNVDATPAVEVGKSTFLRNRTPTMFLRNPVKRKSPGSELAELASKSSLSHGEFRKLLRPSFKDDKKHSENERTPFLRKKQKRG